MNGYSGHTFKFTKEDGSFKYIQIHLKTDQGIENWTNDEAAQVAVKDPDSAGQQDNFVYNVSSHLKDAEERVRKAAYTMFGRVDKDLGLRLEKATEVAAAA
jgi:catalase